MNNDLFEVRAAAQKVKTTMIAFGQENGLSCDAMCMILRDVLGFFEAECERSYADSIMQLGMQNKVLKEELERRVNDITNNQPGPDTAGSATDNTRESV